MAKKNVNVNFEIEIDVQWSLTSEVAHEEIH